MKEYLIVMRYKMPGSLDEYQLVRASCIEDAQKEADGYSDYRILAIHEIRIIKTY